jgi:hypothetical protein
MPQYVAFLHSSRGPKVNICIVIFFSAISISFFFGLQISHLTALFRSPDDIQTLRQKNKNGGKQHTKYMTWAPDEVEQAERRKIRGSTHQTLHHLNKDPIKAKIAVLSSYIGSTMWSKDTKAQFHNLLDHITNRACYCHLWHYDFIVNQTREITFDAEAQPEQIKHRREWWLQFGAWERVAHIQAALDQYDWVLYGDLDYIIKDFSRPIESFIRQLDLYGKNQVHVLLPADENHGTSPSAFSSFAILIKNSPFGRKLLENWRSFAMGICPNGNFQDKGGEMGYDWVHSDQPGLWYALMKTHMDFFPNDVHLSPQIVKCNDTNGLIDDSKTGPWMDFESYFTKNGYRAGNYGEKLAGVFDDQHIIFSRSGSDSMSGLGVDHNWVHNADKFWNHSFALHWRAPSDQWFPDMQRELTLCKRVHGCNASLNELGEIRAGCNSTKHAGM